MSANGRRGQGTNLSGCWRVTCWPTRFAAEGTEAHQHPEWTIKKRSGPPGIWPLSPLHMAEHFPNKPIPVTFVTVPRKRLAMDGCIKRSAHELVAGRRADSVKCKRCMQVCGKEEPAHWGSCCVRSVARPKERLQPLYLLGCLCQAQLTNNLDQRRGRAVRRRGSPKR